jgi:hypothetical protein
VEPALPYPEGERAHGWALLDLLRLSGWDVAETIAFSGGHLVLARNSFGNDVRAEGKTFAAASLVVYEECIRRQRMRETLLGRAA